MGGRKRSKFILVMVGALLLAELALVGVVGLGARRGEPMQLVALPRAVPVHERPSQESAGRTLAPGDRVVAHVYRRLFGESEDERAAGRRSGGRFVPGRWLELDRSSGGGFVGEGWLEPLPLSTRTVYVLGHTALLSQVPPAPGEERPLSIGSKLTVLQPGWRPWVPQGLLVVLRGDAVEGYVAQDQVSDELPGPEEVFGDALKELSKGRYERGLGLVQFALELAPSSGRFEAARNALVVARSEPGSPEVEAELSRTYALGRPERSGPLPEGAGPAYVVDPWLSIHEAPSLDSPERVRVPVNTELARVRAAGDGVWEVAWPGQEEPARTGYVRDESLALAPQHLESLQGGGAAAVRESGGMLLPLMRASVLYPKDRKLWTEVLGLAWRLEHWAVAAQAASVLAGQARQIGRYELEGMSAGQEGLVLRLRNPRAAPLPAAALEVLRLPYAESKGCPAAQVKELSWREAPVPALGPFERAEVRVPVARGEGGDRWGEELAVVAPEDVPEVTNMLAVNRTGIETGPRERGVAVPYRGVRTVPGPLPLKCFEPGGRSWRQPGPAEPPKGSGVVSAGGRSPPQGSGYVPKEFVPGAAPVVPAVVPRPPPPPERPPGPSSTEILKQLEAGKRNIPLKYR